MPSPALSFTSLGPPLLYAIAQRRLHADAWLPNFLALPMLMLFGMGMVSGFLVLAAILPLVKMIDSL